MSHHTGTVPLCSTSGSTSCTLRTSTPGPPGASVATPRPYSRMVARGHTDPTLVRRRASSAVTGCGVCRTVVPVRSRRWPRRRRSSSRWASARCGSPTPTGSTSRPPARRSSTSSTTTSPSGRGSSTRCGSGRACCTASRPGVSGEKVHQKRVPAGAPPWLETVRVHFPRYGLHADELCVTELADVIWAVQMSTVEFHPWNSRRADVEKPDEWRIDLDPMPDCPLADGAARRPRRPRGARRARRRRLAEDVGRQRACTSTSASSRRTAFTDVRRAALAFAREVERRAPDAVTTTWWRKDRDPDGAVRRLQPERPRPHHGRGLLGAGRARSHACRRRSRGTRSTTSSPNDCTMATVPARFAELGDLHAGIDERGLRHRRVARVGGP